MQGTDRPHHCFLWQVDIAIVDELDPPLTASAFVTLFGVGFHSAHSGRDIMARNASWEGEVVPRLRRQAAHSPGAGEGDIIGPLEREQHIPLIVLHWVWGRQHYEPALG